MYRYCYEPIIVGQRQTPADWSRVDSCVLCCGCLEHQPRVRGWLLASVDGQTSGLVPANYVKVLGKRRGRKHAEAERPVQVQQNHAEALQTGHGTRTQPGPSTQGIGSASTADMLLESVYAETPAPPLSVAAAASNSSGTSSVELNIPAKTDL